MGKYTIKKNNLGFSLTKGVFSGEFNPINYIFYLAFLLSIKTCYFIFIEGFLGLNYWGILLFWDSLFEFFQYDLWNSGFSRIGYLFFLSLPILALLPIVYRILNGNGHRNFFIFLALNLVLNILTFRWSGQYYGDTFLNNIFGTLSLIPLFMSFNPKEIQNTDIKMSSKTKLSGNLYDDLD
jgi:hypothetical protein